MEKEMGAELVGTSYKNLACIFFVATLVLWESI